MGAQEARFSLVDSTADTADTSMGDGPVPADSSGTETRCPCWAWVGWAGWALPLPFSRAGLMKSDRRRLRAELPSSTGKPEAFAAGLASPFFPPLATKIGDSAALAFGLICELSCSLPLRGGLLRTSTQSCASMLGLLFSG